MIFGGESETFYNDELRTFVQSRDWPKGAIIRVIEYEDHLGMRLYRDNINSLSGEVKRRLATVLNETLTSIQNRGVPIFTEVAKGNGYDQGA